MSHGSVFDRRALNHGADIWQPQIEWAYVSNPHQLGQEIARLLSHQPIPNKTSFFAPAASLTLKKIWKDHGAEAAPPRVGFGPPAAIVERFCQAIPAEGLPDDIPVRGWWRSNGCTWELDPQVAAAATTLPRPPRIEEGPGFLLACVVDALGQQIQGRCVTDEEQKFFWCTLLLPLLAPARRADAVRTAFGLKNYQQEFAFSLLPPRLQSSIEALDQLSTLLALEDWQTATLVLQAAGMPTEDIKAQFQHVSDGLVAQLIRPDPSEAEGYAFGFRIVRQVLHEMSEGGGLMLRWMQSPNSVQSKGEIGPLGKRLRASLSMALTFPERPPWPTDQAATQLMADIWDRWTDPHFLGEVP